MLVLAHRGANRLAPENTVPAMQEAIDRGADGVELDVHRTADGALAVHHDGALGGRPIPELTLAQVAEAGPDVPVLADVLDVCAGRLVNVELKDPDPRAGDALLALLAERAGGDDVLVSSFDLEAVDHVRAGAPGLRTGYLSFGLDPHSTLAVAFDHGHVAVHPDVWSLLAIDVESFVVRAHDLGLAVNVWTVNDAAQVGRLREAGVDAVITDDTDLYRFGRAHPGTG